MDTRTLKKIYSKLSEEDKTELKSEKVELSIASDARTKMIKAVEKIFNNGEDLYNELENNNKRVQRQISSIEKAFSKAQNIYKDINSKITSQARELGIAPNAVPDFEKFNNTYFYLDRIKTNIINDLNKYK